MAIENVMMMNVIGGIDDVDQFAKDIFLFNDIQIVDAMNEIDTGRFTLTVSEENLNELLGFAHLQSGESLVDEKVFTKLVDRLNDLYNGKLKLDYEMIRNKDINLDEVINKANEYEKYLDKEYTGIQKAQSRLQEIDLSLQAYGYLKDLTVEMKELNAMEYFNYTVGSVSKENAARLKSIYNTVTSILFHVGDREQEEVFLIVSPKDFEVETNRILKALNFKEIEGYDTTYTKTPQAILADLYSEQTALEEQIENNQTILEKHRLSNEDEANEIYSVMELYSNISRIKKYMAFSNQNFYFSAWIAVKDKDKLEAIAHKYKGLILQFNAPDGSNKPPTKLNNNWVFRPFESLVKMYGVPAYNELDPTPFLSITYLFCFGYMFGDIGQGFVFLLAGILFSKRGIQLGRVMTRMACSSMVFGVIYGSVFGNEKLLPALWVKPFDEINTVLLTAVVLGVVMLLAAYAYSIINKLHVGDIKEGVFGKNGVAGLVLYISLLALVLLALGILPGPQMLIPILAVLAVALVFLVLIREPLVNTIKKRKRYDTSAGDYYVESGFELFEMLLAMLSNTLSFIRVGAFALTHVGLFMAFEALAEMAGGGFGGIIVLIIGNVLIIVLEGLIDFIQCLRLQFYELFSKYYTGDGTEFVSLSVELNNTNF